MKHFKLIALGASIALNAFFIFKKGASPKTVELELYTLNDIYYLKGDTLVLILLNWTYGSDG